MALTAPTVASDPATATHTNTALSAVNAFINTAYSETVAAAQAMLDQVQTRDGNMGLIDRMTTAVGALSGGAQAAPTVATSPATQAQTNTALALLATYMDSANSRIKEVLSIFRESVQRTDGNLGILDDLDLAIASLATPSSLVAPTVASDPVTQANMNTALAAATVFVDNANSESFTGLAAVLTHMRRSGSSAAIAHAADGAQASLASP